MGDIPNGLRAAGWIVDRIPKEDVSLLELVTAGVTLHGEKKLAGLLYVAAGCHWWRLHEPWAAHARLGLG